MNNSIGARIKALRESQGMLQKDLAQRLGVTSQAVSSWEIGRTEPNMGQVAKMQEIFKCTITDMISTEQRTITDDEMKLLIEYRNASEQARRLVHNVLALAKGSKEIQNDN